MNAADVAKKILGGADVRKSIKEGITDESKRKVFSSKEEATEAVKAFAAKFMEEHGDDEVAYPFRIKQLLSLYGPTNGRGNYVDMTTPDMQDVIYKIDSAPEPGTEEYWDIYGTIKSTMEDAAYEVEGILFKDEDGTFCFRAYYEINN